MKKARAGFTLIELIIAVAIVAILCAIAYPSYLNHVLRAHRSEARTALLQLQVAQEKFFLQNNRYAGAPTASASAVELNNAPAAPIPGLGIPGSTPNGYYAITLVRPSANAYTATATAVNGQASDTTCLIWSIDQAGRRSATSETCWQ